MKYRIVFSPASLEPLGGWYRHVAGAASPAVAARYTEAIMGYCDCMCAFPMRSTQLDDGRPGSRTTDYK